MKASEKVLLTDNADLSAAKSAANIADVEKNLITPINGFFQALKNAGVATLSLDELKDCIIGGYATFESLIPASETTGVANALTPLIEAERTKKLHSVDVAFGKINGRIYNGVSVKSSDALAMIALDEATGFVVLSDDARNAIMEEHKVYIESETGIELYNIQHELATLMQKFYDKLQASFKLPGKVMPASAHSIANMMFPSAAFYYKHDADGNLTIEPRPINFDPIPESEI